MKAWSEFRNWVKYVREYKDNKENDLVSANQLRDANLTIERLVNELKQKDTLAQEKEELLNKRNNRVSLLTDKLRDEKIINKMHIESIAELTEEIDNLENSLKDKISIIKKLNMKYAQKQRKTQKLEKELQKMEHKINFLEHSKHAPTKEEIIAYETMMKEVEKRQKQK